MPADPFNNDFEMDKQIEDIAMDKKLIAQELIKIAKSLLATKYVAIHKDKHDKEYPFDAHNDKEAMAKVEKIVKSRNGYVRLEKIENGKRVYVVSLYPGEDEPDDE